MSDAPIMAPTAGPDQPLAAANISQLVAVALRLAMEVSTLRERLRTQQVLLEEMGVANVADPLGGSWYVEALTDRMEAQAGVCAVPWLRITQSPC